MEDTKKTVINGAEFSELLKRFEFEECVPIGDHSDRFIGVLDGVRVEIFMDFQQDTGFVTELS